MVVINLEFRIDFSLHNQRIKKAESYNNLTVSRMHEHNS